MKRALTIAASVVAILVTGYFVAPQSVQAAIDGYFSQLLVRGTARIGTGTPGTTQGAGDLFVSDGLEVDGTLRLDGALDLNSTADFAGDVVFNEDVSLAVAADDILTFGAGYATKFRVGTGSTPDITLGADDVMIEGTLEVDSEAQFDGIVDANSTMDVADTATFSKGSGNALVVSAGGAIDANGAADIADTLTLSKSAGNALVIDAGGELDANGTADFADDVAFHGDVDLGDGADTVTLHASAVPVNFPYTISFYQDPELGDGTKEGAMVGELAATASTGTEADLTYAYVDNDAGTASIAGTEDAADCNSATADDCATFADAGAEAIGDALYYCAATQFHGLGFTIAGTAMVNSAPTGEWQYPTADDTWAALTENSDGTNSAQDSLEQTGRVLWAMPEDWFENATGGTKAMAADSGFCVRYVLTAANVTTVAVMDQVTAIVPAATDEDLPQVPIAGTLTGISSNCDTAPSGVATHLTIWNATAGTVAYHTIADGNYADRTGGLSLAFSAGDELAIVSDCDSTGASCAEGCGVVLELQ